MPKHDDLFLFTDVTGETPVTETVPADEPVSTTQDAPVLEAPVTEETPVIEEPAATKEATLEEQPAAEDPSAAEEVPTVEQPSQTEETPAATEDMLEEFRAPDVDTVKIIAPTFAGTADALTAAPKAKPVQKEEDLKDDVAMTTVFKASTATQTQTPDTAADEPTPVRKKNWFMRFLGAIIPHIGDDAFDVVRKLVMIVGILFFIGAATYLIDDMILIPINHDINTKYQQSLYTPNVEQELTQEEQNYNYPEGIDPAFKKLYYQNNDVRGWLIYQTTDGSSFDIRYPIVQSADNDYYLFHDFNGVYNKNGTLFFDYRNDIKSPTSENRNTIIYGHNMASGQMFAGLNLLLHSVNYARVAPTFTMNTIYEQAEYKVFAVMLVNNDPANGVPFGYLRTDFADNVDFASFLSEVMARSLYVYGDVDVRPDDEIVTLSTCTDTGLAHFNDGRTVVVARKVREGEDPSTDVSTINYNADVIMPYGWYQNQKLEPHKYYVDPTYNIEPLDTLMDFLSTSTNPSNKTTTSITFYTDKNGNTVTKPTTTTTTTGFNGTGLTSVQPTKPQMIMISVESTPVNYPVGSRFDFENTKVVAVYSDGSKKAINASQCGVTGFDSSKPGVCNLTVNYGSLYVNFSVNIVGEASTNPTASQPTTAQTAAPTTAAPTTQPTAPPTTTPAPTTITTTPAPTTITTTSTTVSTPPSYSTDFNETTTSTETVPPTTTTTGFSVEFN